MNLNGETITQKYKFMSIELCTLWAGLFDQANNEAVKSYAIPPHIQFNRLYNPSDIHSDRINRGQINNTSELYIPHLIIYPSHI